jgi:hypothetical protein
MVTNNIIKDILKKNIIEKLILYIAGELNESSTAPHALRPPSHLLKARRVSKQNSLSVDNHALQRTHQRQESTNSAVSPRFMAMRKLSEVSPVSDTLIFLLSNGLILS